MRFNDLLSSIQPEKIVQLYLLHSDALGSKSDGANGLRSGKMWSLGLEPTIASHWWL